MNDRRLLSASLSPALAALVFWLAAASWGKEPTPLARCIASMEAKAYGEAIAGLLELSARGGDEVRPEAEYYLAESFRRAGAPFAALIHFVPMVKAGPKHPHHLEAVRALVELQEELDDDVLAPSVLNNAFDASADRWAELPPEVLSRINYLVGRVAFRRGALEEARLFLEAVPERSGLYAHAQYLLGITLADPRFPAADAAERTRHAEQALERFEHLLSVTSPQVDFADTVELTYLALGRVAYGLGQGARAVPWYEKVPRFSRHWDEALFENGFARFLDDDLGGALGSLQGLHAPQFAGAFQPESWILTATIYYFACLYDEARAALAEFDRRYAPMAQQLDRVLAEPGEDLGTAYRLVAQGRGDRLPRAVWNWVRANQRVRGVMALIDRVEADKAHLSSLADPAVVAEVTASLDENRGTLEQVAGSLARSRLLEAQAAMKTFSDQAEIIRFELAKAEKELAEANVDVRAIAAGKALHRPKLPSERWNYWKFQGEFWRDEIGYYQYTLKRLCPPER